MRIAIVGAGLTGLAAADLLGRDPRHALTVFETRAWFGGPVEHLFRLGVTLRRTAQVERLAADGTGTDLWIHGLPERFDLALVATPEREARALLARSGLTRRDVRPRVHFADGSAHDALARMARDHPALATRSLWPPPPRAAGRVRSVARRASVRYLDLSDQRWPLETPAVYIANRRWLLDDAPRRLGLGVAFVVEGGNAAAALAALAVNAPIVPVAANLRRPRTVVIGEPFYAETSSPEDLMADMRLVVRHLERLA